MPILPEASGPAGTKVLDRHVTVNFRTGRRSAAVVLAALLLPAGRGADSIGRRECFLAGLLIFGVASLGCAVAPDLLALIACRALQAAAGRC